MNINVNQFNLNSITKDGPSVIEDINIKEEPSIEIVDESGEESDEPESKQNDSSNQLDLRHFKAETKRYYSRQYRQKYRVELEQPPTHRTEVQDNDELSYHQRTRVNDMRRKMYHDHRLKIKNGKQQAELSVRHIIKEDSRKVKGAPRNVISMEEKINILNRLKTGEKIASISRDLSLNQSTIDTIKKNELKIREYVESGYPLHVSRVVYPYKVVENMERFLISWIQDNNMERIPLDDNMIKQEACNIYKLVFNELYPLSEQRDFTPSYDWFRNFKKRYFLDKTNITGIGDYRRTVKAVEEDPLCTVDEYLEEVDTTDISDDIQVRKRKNIDMAEKVKILDRLRDGETASTIARSLNLNRSTISTIKKNEKKIRERCKYNSSGCKIAPSKYVVISNMETLLIDWIEENNKQKRPLNSYTIRQKALQLYSDLNETNPTVSNREFTASRGWFERFQTRWSLRFKHTNVNARKCEQNEAGRKMILISEKLKILDRLNGGETIAHIAATLNVNSSTIATIRKNEQRIREYVAGGSSTQYIRVDRLKEEIMEKMQKLLIGWIENAANKQFPLSGGVIRQQALKIYKHLKENGLAADGHDFRASKGWYQKFKSRFAISKFINGTRLMGNEVGSETEIIEDKEPTSILPLTIKESFIDILG